MLNFNSIKFYEITYVLLISIQKLRIELLNITLLMTDTSWKWSIDKYQNHVGKQQKHNVLNERCTLNPKHTMDKE